MLFYGICTSDIAHVNWEAAVLLLKDFDENRYQDYLSDMQDIFESGEKVSEKDTEDWFDNYDSSGMTGLGAFLHDVIEEKEKVQMDLEWGEGLFLGLHMLPPWQYHESVQHITEEEFCDILRKYVNLVTTDELVIKFWDLND